jgi:hypothetical protein
MPAKKSCFKKGDDAVVKTTGTLVQVVTVHGDNVLAKRVDNGLQWTYSADQLLPTQGAVCPV